MQYRLLIVVCIYNHMRHVYKFKIPRAVRRARTIDFFVKETNKVGSKFNIVMDNTVQSVKAVSLTRDKAIFEGK